MNNADTEHNSKTEENLKTEDDIDIPRFDIVAGKEYHHEYFSFRDECDYCSRRLAISSTTWIDVPPFSLTQLKCVM